MPSRTSFDVLEAHGDRPARLQMMLALILLLLLVAIPLYLWRRPRAESIAASAGGGEASPLPLAPSAPSPDEKPVTIGEAVVSSCQDPGSKKTLPLACDHVVELERALGRAVEESATCAPREAGGGTIVYVFDVSFKKKSILVSTPKDGRSLRSSKVAGACERAVKSRLGAVPFDTWKHEHARYRISLTASYSGLARP